MKKRFLAIVLTLVMALALAVPSFAATMPTKYLTHEVLKDETVGSVYDSVIHQNWANTNNTLLKVIHQSTLLGYVNVNGNQIVQEKYDDIGNFTADHLAWAMRDGVACYVNPSGTEVISVGVAKPDDFSNGMARITDQWGNTYFINTNGDVVFNIGKSTAGRFDSNGLVWVKTGDKYGIVNKLGQEVAHFQYDNLSILPDGRLYYNSGLLRAVKNGTVVFLDVNGNEKIWVTAPNIKEVSNFSNGMCLLKDTYGQVGYMDTTGWLAVYCQYEDGADFTGLGIARIKRDGKYGYIDKVNKYVVQPEYDYLDTVAVDNLILAGKVVSNTQVVPSYQYSTIENGVKVDHKVGETKTQAGDYALFGYVNVKTGVEQIPLQYHTAHRFSEGVAQVSKYATKGFINEAGTVLIYDTYYDALGDFHSGRAWAAKNGKYGFIDVTGKIVISATFDCPIDGRNPYDFQGNKALVRLADFSFTSRYGIIDINGNYIYAPTFSDVIYFNPQVDNVALFQAGGINNAIVQLTR